MFCSECGAKATGKFCSQCGHRLNTSGSDDGPLVVAPQANDLAGDWSQVVDYPTLLRHVEVRQRIAQAAAEATASMTGEEFLKLCEKALTPLTQAPIPLTLIAKVGQPLNASLGMKTGKQRSEFFTQPPGQVLVSVLCSLARHGRKLKQVRQIEAGCVLEADLGSDMFALAGNLTVIVHRQGDGVVVEATTHIPGQLFDWGKSARCLDQILGEVQSFAANGAVMPQPTANLRLVSCELVK